MNAESEFQEPEFKLAEPPGRKLQAARERAGLSQRRIAEELRLEERVIDALERGDQQVLPAPIFVRGYLRNYAGLLGLPSEDLIAEYNRQLEAETTAVGTRRKVDRQESNRWAVVFGWLLALTLVTLAGIWVWYDGTPWRRMVEPAPPSASVSEDAISAPQAPAAPDVSVSDPVPEPPPPPSEDPPQPEAGPVADRGTTTTPETLAVPSSQTQPQSAEGPAPTDGNQTTADADPGLQPDPTAGAPEPTAASQAPQVVADEQVVPPTAEPVAQTDRLELRLEGASWVEISDATGKRLLYRLAGAGERHELEGQAPFQVLIGNAEAATLVVNGRTIDLEPHRRGRVARLRTPTQPE